MSARSRHATGERTIDGTGLVLAPGFIDAHNHSTDGLDGDPDAVTQVSQGITTVLLGQDGSSPFPLRDYLARRRAAPAQSTSPLLVGHATIRRQVMGDDFRRAATAAEVAKMEALVDQEMRDGAIGLSSGLEYEVGSYALDRGSRRAGTGRRTSPRLLHLAHPRRSRPDARSGTRSDRDR